MASLVPLPSRLLISGSFIKTSQLPGTVSLDVRGAPRSCKGGGDEQIRNIRDAGQSPSHVLGDFVHVRLPEVPDYSREAVPNRISAPPANQCRLRKQRLGR